MQKRLVFLLIPLLAVTLWGCGSNRDSNDDSTTPTVEVSDAGQAGNCTVCHTVGVHTQVSGLVGQNPNVLGQSTAITHDCEDCHGGGQYHHGEGPIPYPAPDIARCAVCHADQVEKTLASKHNGEEPENTSMATTGHASGTCQACHTLEGYLEYAKVTSDNTIGTWVPVDPAPTGFHYPTCAACHDPLTAGLRPTPNWDPNNNGKSDQFDMCTSCHKLIMPDGTPIASGLAVNGVSTVAKVQHYKDWYRNITTTHYDLPQTGMQSSSKGDGVLDQHAMIEGYVVRKDKASACTDCHGHELYTNTGGLNNATPAADASTIHTQWAQSGHAGKILANKLATSATNAYARTAATNQAIMATSVTAESGPAWEHYDWDAISRQGCQKCHTATGIANYLTNPAGYSTKKNDFSHLANWAPATKNSAGEFTAAGVAGQNELLYCWGCHKSVETGEVRNPIGTAKDAGGVLLTGIPAEYKFKGANFSFPDVGSSNLCFACHAGRVGGEDIVALTTAANPFTNVGFKNSHYMAAAGLMYAKIGYINFIDPATAIGSSTYGKSLTTPEDGGVLTSTHRKLGTAAIVGDHGITAADDLDTDGPCVACHYAKGSHSLEMDAAAFDNTCVKCHTAEGTTILTAENFKEVFIEEQAVPFDDALALAEAKLLANYGIVYDPSVNPYFFETVANGGAAVTNWTRSGALTAAEAEKLMGACFNINVLTRDPAAYVHARTYTRRLIYDSIDWLDDKIINMSTGATATAWDSVKYIKDATAGGTTTESFKYLAGYNRTSLVWNALERP